MLLSKMVDDGNMYRVIMNLMSVLVKYMTKTYHFSSIYFREILSFQVNVPQENLIISAQNNWKLLLLHLNIHQYCICISTQYISVKL